MRILSLLIGLLAPQAHAVVLERAGGAATTQMWQTICATLPFCNLGQGAPSYFAAKITSFILLLIGGVAVLVIIYGAIKVIISAGGDEGLTETKKMIMYALAGLILAMLANMYIPYFIAVVVPQMFGG